MVLHSLRMGWWAVSFPWSRHLFEWFHGYDGRPLVFCPRCRRVLWVGER